MKYFYTAIVILILFCGCTSTSKEAYVFSYFVGNGQDGLHLAYSYDGFNWMETNDGNAIVSPVVGPDSLMRDPSIIQAPDGTFHMVWTTGWWDRGIGYASSPDLINWSEQRFLPVMEADSSTRNTWAPELFFDSSENLFYIVWASTVPDRFAEIATSDNERGLNHRLYFTTTSDFIDFAPSKLFFDQGFSVIDGAFFQKANKTWMVVKNEMSVPSEKNLRITSTNRIADGFSTEVSQNISGDSWAEGPSPLVLGDSVIIYFDKYREHKYGAIISADCENWYDASNRISLPAGIRHGTAIVVDKSIVENLETVLTKKDL